MALAALIVSIVSALGSLAAIAVSVWTHRQLGSRIECKWGTALPIVGGEVGDRHVQVTGINKGRSPATIEGWGFVVLDRRGRETDTTIVVTQPLPWLPTLPHRLEAESSASWMLALDDLVASRLMSAHPRAEIKAFVRTGTGRMVTDSRPVPLDWG